MSSEQMAQLLEIQISTNGLLRRFLGATRTLFTLQLSVLTIFSRSWVLKTLGVSFAPILISVFTSILTLAFSRLVIEADPKKYFSLGARLFSLELLKLFTLFLARTSSGVIDDRITSKRFEVISLTL